MDKNQKTKNMNKNEKQNKKIKNKRYVQAKISSSGSLSDFGQILGNFIIIFFFIYTINISYDPFYRFFY